MLDPAGVGAEHVAQVGHAVLQRAEAVDVYAKVAALILSKPSSILVIIISTAIMFASDVRWLEHYGFSAFQAPNPATGLS